MWGCQGIDTHFITNSLDEWDPDAQSGVHIHVIEASAKFLKLTRPRYFLEMWTAHARQRKALRQLGLKLKPLGNWRDEGCVIACSPYPASVLGAAFLKRRLKTRAVIFFYHIPPPPWSHPSKHGGLIRSLGNWLTFQFALVVAKLADMSPGVTSTTFLSDVGWRVPSTTVKLEGILRVSAQIPDRLPGRSARSGACYVGRLAPNKGIVDLIETWAIVTRVVPSVELVIAGEWTDSHFRRKVEERVTRLGLWDRIRFAGPVSETEKTSLLSASRVFVFPSYEEGWSLSVMEAAAAGCLPVVYELPAYQYLGDSVVKVSLGDVPALGRAVTAILSGHLDITERVRTAQSKVQDFTAEVVAARVLSQFERRF